MTALCGDVFISKLRKFRLSFAVFQYSNPYFPNISDYPLQIFHTCEKIRRRADHHRCIFIYIYYLEIEQLEMFNLMFLLDCTFLLLWFFKSILIITCILYT